MIAPHGWWSDSAPRPRSFENVEHLGPPLQSPRMPTLVIVDAESVQKLYRHLAEPLLQGPAARTLCPSRRTPRRRRRFPPVAPARRAISAAPPRPRDHRVVRPGQRGRGLPPPARLRGRRARVAAAEFYDDVPSMARRLLACWSRTGDLRDAGFGAGARLRRSFSTPTVRSAAGERPFGDATGQKVAVKCVARGRAAADGAVGGRPRRRILLGLDCSFDEVTEARRR